MVSHMNIISMCFMSVIVHTMNPPRNILIYGHNIDAHLQLTTVLIGADFTVMVPHMPMSTERSTTTSVL